MDRHDGRLEEFRQKLSAFGADQQGNIALTFLLVALPIIAFVGAAVDYSRANSVKASMQSALDATALLMSKEAATDTDTQRRDNALKYFSKLFDPPQVTGAKLDASNIHVDVTFDPSNNSQILLSASAQLPAEFVKVLGFDTFTVKANSTAKWDIAAPSWRCTMASKGLPDVRMRIAFARSDGPPDKAVRTASTDDRSKKSGERSRQDVFDAHADVVDDILADLYDHQFRLRHEQHSPGAGWNRGWDRLAVAVRQVDEVALLGIWTPPSAPPSTRASKRSRARCDDLVGKGAPAHQVF